MKGTTSVYIQVKMLSAVNMTHPHNFRLFRDVCLPEKSHELNRQVRRKLRNLRCALELEIVVGQSAFLHNFLSQRLRKQLNHGDTHDISMWVVCGGARITGHSRQPLHTV